MSNQQFSPQRFPARQHWYALLLLLSVLAIVFVLYAYRLFEEVRERETNQLLTQTRVVTENLEQQLRSVDQALRALQDDAVELLNLPRAELDRRLGLLTSAMPAIRTLLILDAEGMARGSNRTAPDIYDFGARDYFQLAKSRPDADLLFMSAPFKTALGVYAITATRTLHAADGSFAGVITATLDPEYFRDLLGSVFYASDMRSAIWHGDGVEFIHEESEGSASASDSPQDSPAPGSPFLQHMAGGLEASVYPRVEVAGAEPVMLALRTLLPTTLNLDSTLVVSVSRDLDSILQRWRRDAWALFGLFSFFALLSAIGLRAYERRRSNFLSRAEEASVAQARLAERLELAVGSGRIGVWDFYIGNERLIWDATMHALYGLRDTETAVTFQTWRDCVLPEDLPEAERALQDTLDNDVSYVPVFRIRRANDGAVRYIEAHARVIREEGKAVRMVGTNQDITKRFQMEAALRESQAELQEAQRVAQVGHWTLDLQTQQVYWSEQLFVMLGLDPAGIPPDYTEQHRLFTAESWMRLSASVARTQDEGIPYDLELEMVRPDGSRGWMQVRGEPVRNDAGAIVGLRGIAADISIRKKNEAQLLLASSVFSNTREGIVISDADNRIIEINDAFTRITGYSREDVIGKNPSLLTSGHQGREFYTAMWNSLMHRGYWSGEVWNRRKSGEVYAEMLTVSVVRDATGQLVHHVGVFADISMLKEHERQIERIAHFDALTGLPNRVLLADRLQQGMAHARRNNLMLTVILFDLDGFKRINEVYDQEVGDQFLMALAKRTQKTLRAADTLARMGGDEFVVVFLNQRGVQESLGRINRLVEDLAKPVMVGGKEIAVSASVGVTYYPQAEAIDADQLLRQADLAMYQAKLAGKNRYHIFDIEQERSLRGYHENLQSVEHALQARQFVLFYQPKVNMRTGAILGVEALIRWQHPERGLLSPAAFLPTVENHHLAVDVGEWVINEALTQLEIWQAAGLSTRVSVNISGIHLRETDFVERLAALLALHPQIPASHLELEVLESSTLGDLAQVSHVIEQCHAIGVDFAFDDFGTGYSSLTYLKRLSAKVIKIDQSFRARPAG
ncbi:MAG: EAL domain-containing protein [Gammaproteobacteria bacterium]|nr:EAL domain-containing protein [Gammaproteobacteria bacterium]